MKIDTVVSGIKNLVNNEWLRRTGKALLYALHVVVHPFDGFWDLKNEKRGTASAATIIVILVLMTRLLSLQFTSFQFMEVNWEKINIWMEMAQILLPLIIWVVANWCLTTLFDGKGSMTEVYIATAYALAPYVLIQIPLFIFSNMVTNEEGALYVFFNSLSILWCAALLLVGLSQTHDYTMSKTVLSVVASVVGMIVIVVLCLLIFSMASEAVAYFTSFFQELIIRFY
jgi:hypothetical protein